MPHKITADALSKILKDQTDDTSWTGIPVQIEKDKLLDAGQQARVLIQQWKAMDGFVQAAECLNLIESRPTEDQLKQSESDAPVEADVGVAGEFDTLDRNLRAEFGEICNVTGLVSLVNVARDLDAFKNEARSLKREIEAVQVGSEFFKLDPLTDSIRFTSGLISKFEEDGQEDLQDFERIKEGLQLIVELSQCIIEEGSLNSIFGSDQRRERLQKFLREFETSNVA